jgi:hypothetical protein
MGVFAMSGFLVEIVAHEVGLVVEDELLRQLLGALIGHVLVGGLRLGHVEHRTEHLVHGQEGRRKAGGGLQEGAAVHAVVLAVLLAVLLDQALHLTLFLRLRHRVVLAVRHDLCRYR